MRVLLVAWILLCPGCCCCLSTGANVQNVVVHKRYPPAHANHVIRVYLPVTEKDGVRRILPLSVYERQTLRPQPDEAPPHEVLATIDVETTLFGSDELAVEYAKRESRQLGGDGLVVLSTNLPHSSGGWFASRWRFMAIRYLED